MINSDEPSTHRDYRDDRPEVVGMIQVVDMDEFDGETRLVVVIPMFREACRIGRTVERLAKSGLNRSEFRFCFVDDGSPDDSSGVTRSAIDEFSLVNAEVLTLKSNVGKGSATRHGILHAAHKAPVVGYLDADLSLDPSIVIDALDTMSANGADVVVGRRVVDPSNQPWLRLIGSIGYRQIARRIVPTGVNDPQCAMKLFRSDVARPLFEKLRTQGFAFDVEILALLRQDKRYIYEVPVLWEHQPGSSVGWPDSISMLRELVAIRRTIASRQ